MKSLFYKQSRKMLRDENETALPQEHFFDKNFESFFFIFLTKSKYKLPREIAKYKLRIFMHFYIFVKTSRRKWVLNLSNIVRNILLWNIKIFMHLCFYEHNKKFKFDT
ncbi:hypothetical protein K0M31_002332 [Melipona bicolor]|uniref:Uncharacterized protein n=1 Tax=Melipona bicolor TaxID=60889 RepID=A0AA40KZ31_9HYME|nr:hypothetical protein K0M31_002332 [Melipona bicolor]